MIVIGSPDKPIMDQKPTAPTHCGDRMPVARKLPDANIPSVAHRITAMGSGGCELCGGTECVALASDPQHCGSCSNACPPGVACESGSCACAGAAQACGGVCVDTTTDPAHCGDCGQACSP